ncbi:TetR/AcrR family transcriptional regulator [Streptomyces sp. NPDC051940]|uniref:TetR/AcrR family transcriptional regulator n=1 Tax=Streptomyces sp. NPDC051940 TaxID=3155675 RepID=UPI00343FCEC8
MSPQRSNRAELINGTLRCLERLPPERITARVIAEESGANIASITYHFGSKDALVTEAAIAGLDRWLTEVAAALAGVDARSPADRFRLAGQAVEATRLRHAGLARSYLAALARGRHDERIRATLAEGFRRARPEVAGLLGLGADRTGNDAAGLVLALFHGLMIQVLLAPDLAVDEPYASAAYARLRTLLPEDGKPEPAQ